ncbi:hypothetical protein ZYGR_0AD02190 [Zygosaccharomyces rouxii]|uniref:Pre-mRNA-splicing factor 18 n=2 Tax=Zygosaccharomyces rouxii TaxID=4956 RepID=C5E0A3_ZYGRC|nr:uncharacterized protein ZYRO0G11044g [Zygosaccharomyces rouxii]KAH9202531.1 hypothetical protein LQ764DRAFT_222668 [Zygosaccharomyces rouxii]GAV51036.1 hypothetical protein ZYGR_0AD02190 [Zygosaccharomyces rouxii]CAR29537.1 ZYRO0G11044p [Zygosaccharomyces rouxii]
MDIGNLLKAEIDKKKNALDLKNRQVEEEPRVASSLPAHPEQGEKSSDMLDLTQNNGHKAENASNPDESTLERLRTRPERIERAIEEDSQVSIDIDPVTIGDSERRQELSMQCNIYIHDLLKDWSNREYQPHLLPETAKCFFPLLVRLRKSNLDLDLLTSLATVLYHLQRDEFQQATESYMKLSIGNVAWPIGVTSVGIHARSAQSRIQGDHNVANIMVDDRTRLWITSVKRLITFRESCSVGSN